MQGKAKARGFLVLALGLVFANAAAAADEVQPFRRWGVGWGEQLPGHDEYYGYYGLRAIGVRYRTPSGWNLTAMGVFSTSSVSTQGWDDNPDYYTYDQRENESSSDPVSRSFGFSCARVFPLHPRLSLAPVLRIAHTYSRSVQEDADLDADSDGNDWEFDTSRSRYRSDTLSFSLGLRPQISLHPRVTVESSVYLDYRRTHTRQNDWDREESSDGSVALWESSSSRESSDWSWAVPTPSVTMGLVLFFYF